MKRSNSLTFAPSLETLGERLNLSASPMPVLMVIADQRDFAVETRTEPATPNGANFLFGDGAVRSPDSGGSNVLLGDGSVRFLQESVAGVGFLRSVDGGQTWGDTGHDDVWVDGKVITAENPKADYSAVVFVGGWGSSMYQYSFEGSY